MSQNNINKKFKAQSLLELLVAISVGIILIGSSVTIMGVSLRIYKSIREKYTASTLLRAESEELISLSHDNWHNLDDLTRNSDYYATSTNNVWSINSGQETGILNNIPYRRYFKVYDVNRDDNGNISPSGTLDSNTLKLIAFIEYGNNYVSSSSLAFYLTRSANNQVMHQTDWSGGSGQTGPLPNPGNKFDSQTNIEYSTVGQITMATTTSDAELTSSILDTGVSGGAGFNSLLWQGDLGTGGTVKFQIAFSNNQAGSWTYYGSSSTSDYYLPNPGVSIDFPTTDLASPQNYRYIRYKVYLSTTGTSPRVDDIIINWSP